MLVFAQLRVLAEFRRRHLPFLRTIEDHDLAREIGASTVIVPPCICTISRAILRPRPKPARAIAVKAMGEEEPLVATADGDVPAPPSGVAKLRPRAARILPGP